MNKLLLILLLPPFMYGMEIPNHALIAKDSVRLLHDKTHFYVSDENASYRVENHEVSPLLKQVLKRNALSEYSKSCKIRVKKHKDGMYSLVEKVPGKGGGAVLAGLFYGVVKVGAYAGMVAMGVGAGAAVTAATGGTAAAPVVAGTIVLAKGALGATAGMAAVGTAVATTSAGAALGTGTAALIATSGGVAGYLAAVESAALWAGAVGMALGPV
jgi:hypothetical protein